MLSSIYPDNWPAIATAVKEACNWRCQQCGCRCRRPGELYLGWQYQLTVAHLTQDYEAEAVTVAALCAPCHLAYDAPHVWRARRRWMRYRLRQAGQMTLPL